MRELFCMQSCIFGKSYIKYLSCSEESEKYPQKKNEIIQQYTSFLQEVYSQIDEPDGLEGIKFWLSNS